MTITLDTPNVLADIDNAEAVTNAGAVTTTAPKPAGTAAGTAGSHEPSARDAVEAVIRPPGQLGSVNVSIPVELRRPTNPHGEVRSNANDGMPINEAFVRRRAQMRAERQRTQRPGIRGTFAATGVSAGAGVAALVVVLAVAATLLVLRSPWFAVQQIEIRVGVAEGEGQRSSNQQNEPGIVKAGIHETSLRDEVRKVAARELKVPLARVDIDRLAKDVEKRPDAASVHVVKRWPDRLDITVTPRIPLAEVRFAEGTTSRVDGAGVHLSSAAFGDLPVVRLAPSLVPGTADASERIADALRLLDAMNERTRSTLDFVDHFGNEFVLRSGVTSIIYGRAELVEAKATAIGSLIKSGRVNGPVAIDVTVPDAVVVNG